ncbi:Uncharacterized protein TCM_045343 [Theobroma cacao]|uniref:Uncharacterized protein n=1 Tax=Theobroma cacao TaxID=3641 RepID=A0A061FSN9_THECC|nr:Uncharacterized protein TCM_045343 [Theobroma cacao]
MLGVCGVAPFNEALATIVHPTEGMEKCYDIWVLNGYSWTKQLTIGPILGAERLLALWKNGELLLLSENNTLVMFDPCTGELHDFGIHMSKYTMWLVVYAESIIRIKGISEYDAKLTRQVLLKIFQALSQLHQTLFMIDQKLDQVSQHSSTKEHNGLAEAAAKLKSNQEDLKEIFYGLRDEVLGMIGTKEKEDDLKDLAVGLGSLKSKGDELNERVIESMRDYNIVPKCSGIEEGYKPLDFESPAMEIKTSLEHRRLFNSNLLFLEAEDQIVLDEDLGELEEKDEEELKWLRVKKLKQIFQELKKKIDLNVSSKASDSGDELGPEPVNLGIIFLKVIRNWTFHIEYVLIDLLSKIYYIFSVNDELETISQDLKSNLKHMMEIYLGMVPISVYKIIYMMENPEELKRKGLVIRMCCWCIAFFNEALATIVHPRDGMEKCYSIWVLNGYSWTKKLTIGPIVGVERPLALWKNGELFQLSVPEYRIWHEPSFEKFTSHIDYLIEMNIRVVRNLLK